MKVFEVRHDFSYQSVVTDDETGSKEVFRRSNAILNGTATSIGDFDFPTYYVSTPKSKKGNFFNISNGLLLFDNTVYSSLERLVVAAGEIFRVPVEEIGEKIALHVTEYCHTALDNEKSSWQDEPDGRKIVIEKYAFDPKQIITKSGLFRIPENRFSKILAVTNRPGNENDFYKKYKELNMTGLEFRLLWEDGEYDQ